MYLCTTLDNVLNNALDNVLNIVLDNVLSNVVCIARWSRDVPTSDNEPNSPFTDSACCLPTITCTKPSKVMILINDNRVYYKILRKTSLTLFDI